MTTVRVAAVRASYVVMNREATIDRVADLTRDAAAKGAQLVVFPEVFVSGTLFWIDTRPLWFRLHVDTSPRPAVVVESFALPEREPVA